MMSDAKAPFSQNHLVDNLVYFARALRRAGLPIGPASVIDAARALEASGIESRKDFYWTLHAVFVRKHEHSLIFDETFRLFWRSRGLIEKMMEMLSPVAPPRADGQKPRAGESRVAQAFKALKERESELTRPEIEVDARFTVSGREVLRSKDFAQMSVEELSKAQNAIRQLKLPNDQRETRRLISSPRGALDPRNSLKASLRSGGDMIVLRRRRPAIQPPPLVALCDISGSMSQYTRVFLHFLHALMESRRNVHVFLFGTRLTNVTRQLRMKDPDEALMACSNGVEDWSGGTRIAGALHDFNKHWSRRVLSGGPTVLLISDGLERDTDEDLSREMDRLHRSCRRLIWLNPLLRFDGFEAKARGVRLMLPHIDEFRPVHSLDTVGDLVAALTSTGVDYAADPRRWLKGGRADKQE